MIYFNGSFTVIILDRTYLEKLTHKNSLLVNYFSQVKLYMCQIEKHILHNYKIVNGHDIRKLFIKVVESYNGTLADN